MKIIETLEFKLKFINFDEENILYIILFRFCKILLKQRNIRKYEIS